MIESVIPKSKNTTLPANLAPSISLGILTKPFLPVLVVHSSRKESSDLLTINVPGTLPLKETLLFDNLHSPSLPSLNDNETGTLGSLTIVAQEDRKTNEKIVNKIFFTNLLYRLYLIRSNEITLFNKRRNAIMQYSCDYS